MKTVRTRFPFNGMPKGHVFSYDPETDGKINALILTGVLEELPSTSAATIVFEMPSIDSAEEVGEINGEGSDQPSAGGGDRPAVDDAPSDEGVQGNEGDGPKVAKGRKSRTDVSPDG